MAGLALAREEQYRFTVLVLHPLERPAIQGRDIQGLLTGGMWIEFCTYFIGQDPYLSVVSAAADEVCHAVKVFRGQHVLLRECESKNGIIRYILPVYEMSDYILIDTERKHPGYHPHGKTYLIGQFCNLRDLVKLTCRKKTKMERRLIRE